MKADGTGETYEVHRHNVVQAAFGDAMQRVESVGARRATPYSRLSTRTVAINASSTRLAASANPS